MGNKELMIECNQLTNTSARYKAVIDERDGQIESLSHCNRDFKEKVQKQHIEIGELNSRIKKLTNMADQLKNEYVATKDAMGKEIETAKASNDLSAKQIET